MDPQPAESLEVTFTAMPQDYRRVTRRFAIRLRRIRAVLIATSSMAMLSFVAAFVMLALGATGMEDLSGVVNMLCLLGCVGAIFPAQLLLLRPAVMKRRAVKHSDASGEITWRVGADFLTVISPRAQSDLQWSLFKEAYDLGAYYALAYAENSNMCQFIPKRAFLAPEQDAQFRQYVEAALGPIKL